MKTVQIVTIGSEMTLGLRVDRNAARVCTVLGELGYACTRITTVPDDRRGISDAVSEAARAADLVIVTGGLGPTEDDITREALAEVLGAPLVLHEDMLALLRRRYGKTAASLKGVSRQAYAPQGVTVIPPKLGSAPGLDARLEDARIVALPGVPGEMEEMLARLRDSLRVDDGRVRKVRSIKTCGRGETDIEERIRPIMDIPDAPAVTLLARPGEVEIILVGEGPAGHEVGASMTELEASLVDALGDDVYGFDEESLESHIGVLLAEGGLSLSVAESCTGGAIAQRITDVPGSSRYFLGGVVAYANGAKESLLHVDSEVLERDGAVSAAAALEMELGVRKAFGSVLGLSATGIAGPTGGTQEKPVGLVYIAAGDSRRSHCKEFRFRGPRHTIAERATQSALCLLRAFILDLEGEGGG